jgi:hypothetical protein
MISRVYWFGLWSTRGCDIVRMAREQPPRVAFFFPHIREPPMYHLARRGRITDAVYDLGSHKERVVAVNAKELDLAIESVEVNYPAVDESVKYGPPTCDHLVGRRVDRELVRPEAFECCDIARKGGRALLVVKRPNDFFFRHAILRERRHGGRQAEQQDNCRGEWYFHEASDVPRGRREACRAA